MPLEQPPKTVPEACGDWLGGKASKRALYIAIHDGRLKAAEPKGCKAWLVEKVDVEKCREKGNPQELNSSVRHQGGRSILSVT
jgi:hypothetical protein